MEDINSKNDLYTLIPIEEFKTLMGVDDREDRLCRFCLVTASLTIEEYCKRKFLRKQYFEVFNWAGKLLLILKEYPVSEILAVYTYNEKQFFENCGMILEPEFYRPMIGNDYNEEMPFELLFSPSLKHRELKAIKVIYLAGYIKKNNEKRTENNGQLDVSVGESYERLPVQNIPLAVPADLSAACLELASWNMNRYRGRRVGMSGNIRGAGVQGEHFELSIPENVKALIEPYRRKTI